MKKILLVATSIASLSLMAAPLEEPSIKAEVKMYETNSDSVRDEQNNVLRSAKAECEEVSKTYYLKRRQRKYRRECEKEAETVYKNALEENTVTELVSTVNTSNESGRAVIVSLIRQDKHTELYNTMKLLREIARDSVVQSRVKTLKELKNVETISLNMVASLYDGARSQDSGRVEIQVGNYKPTTVWSLYPYNNRDEDEYFIISDGIGRRGAIVDPPTKLELVVQRLNSLIDSIEIRIEKESGLDDIVDDFSSLEDKSEVKETRFI